MEDSESLVKIGDANGDDLQAVSYSLKDYVKTENDNVLQVITDKLNARPGLIGVLFPSKIQKEHEQLTIQQMKDMFKVRQDVLALYVNAQMELAKKASEMLILSKTQQYEGELSRQGMAIRAELTAFSQMKINEMSTVFEKSRIAFGERRSRQIHDAEKYQNDKYYYDRLQANLDREVDIFFDTIEDLLAGFKEALTNKLNQSTT